MKKKINISELLKDCPSGMELDCTCADNVVFEKIIEYEQIKCVIGESRDPLILDKYGRLIHICCPKCVIFPKGKTTWEGFVPPCKFKFKDGDVIVDKYGAVAIYKRVYSSYEEPYVDFYCGITSLNRSLFIKDSDSLQHCGEIYTIRLATEEEKKELFQAIKEHGYKWNAETKTLEKLSESNEDVDDEILMSGIYFDRKYYSDEVELHLDNYEIEVRDGKTYAIFKNQETKNSKPNFKVGDKIKCKSLNIFNPIEITAVTPRMYTFSDGSFQYVEIIDKNYELVPNKFDITTLVPFESKVLVRDCDSHVWEGEIYTRYANKSFNNCNFVTLGGRRWKECIPYEGNEHLLGKTDDCYEYFKIWE